MKVQDLGLQEIDAKELDCIEGGVIIGPGYYALDMLGSFCAGVLFNIF